MEEFWLRVLFPISFLPEIFVPGLCWENPGFSLLTECEASGASQGQAVLGGRTPPSPGCCPASLPGRWRTRRVGWGGRWELWGGTWRGALSEGYVWGVQGCQYQDSPPLFCFPVAQPVQPPSPCSGTILTLRTLRIFSLQNCFCFHSFEICETWEKLLPGC